MVIAAVLLKMMFVAVVSVTVMFVATMGLSRAGAQVLHADDDVMNVYAGIVVFLVFFTIMDIMNIGSWIFPV